MIFLHLFPIDSIFDMFFFQWINTNNCAAPEKAVIPYFLRAVNAKPPKKKRAPGCASGAACWWGVVMAPRRCRAETFRQCHWKNKICVGNNPLANIKRFVLKRIPDTKLVFSFVSKSFIYIPKFDINSSEITCQNKKLGKLVQITSKSATVLTSQ